MIDLLKEVLALAAARHNTLTVAVLRANGITASRQRALVQAGVLGRIADGVYRFTGGAPNEAALCAAACSHRFGLIVAAPTAGRQWAFRNMPADHLIWVLAPPASHPIKAAWLRPYRTPLIADEDIVEREDGIRLTSPARTVVDLTRHLGVGALRSVIDQVEHEGMGTAATMRRVAQSLDTPGRPWARKFLAVLDDRAAGTRRSHGESRVVAALRERGIPNLVSNRWLTLPSWGKVCLDAAVDELRWGVEVDIHPDHWTEVGSARDRDRDLACDAAGWRVSRAAKLSLQWRFDATIDRLVAVYEQRRRELAA